MYPFGILGRRGGVRQSQDFYHHTGTKNADKYPCIEWEYP